MPVVRSHSSALAATWRGSRSYGSPVRGSTMEKLTFKVFAARNGSTYAVATSGISFMSDLWIAAKPRIDEPSNITPSVKKSSGSVAAGTLKCCCWPGRSVNRTSTNSTFSFLMKLRASSELLNIRPPLHSCCGREAMFRRLPSGVPNVSGTFRRASGASLLPPDDGGVGQSVVHAPVVPVEDQGGDEQREQGGAADRSQRVDGDVLRDPDDPQAEQMHAEGPAGDEHADD